MLPHCAKQSNEAIARLCRLGMVCAKHLLLDCHRLGIQVSGFIALPLSFSKPCKVVHTLSRIWMLLPQAVDPDMQGAFVERLGLLILALQIVELGQTRETVCDIGMRSQRFLAND